MFQLLRNQSRSAAGAIQYVTIGTLMIIWAGLWYYYFVYPIADPSPWQRFVCVGLILSGVAIALIGLMFGLIGRGARAADNTVGVADTGPSAPVAMVVPTVSPTPTATAPVATAPLNATQPVRVNGSQVKSVPSDVEIIRG